MSSHEPIVSHRRIVAGSDRSLGLVFAGFFLIVAIAPLLHRNGVRWWALGVAALFLLVACAAPRLLSPLNRLWLRLGLALGRVAAPAVIALVYYGVVVPIGLIVQRKDPLRLRRDPGAATYWVARDPPAPPPGSMSRQF
jgi:hypothetical protein